jgi:hypothetical protein
VELHFYLLFIMENHEKPPQMARDANLEALGDSDSVIDIS